MRFASPNRRRTSKVEINLVPMIDVLTVLIFFFLLTMQFKHFRALMICPPHMDSAGPATTMPSVTITINESGQYFYNSRSVSSDELVQLLKLASEGAINKEVLIVADENVPLKKVAFAMDEARKAKLDSIRLQTR